MKIKQIIQDAKENGIDPVQAVRDYLNEKDSRCTLEEARRIVQRNE
jgi:hypothetical protein